MKKMVPLGHFIQELRKSLAGKTVVRYIELGYIPKTFGYQYQNQCSWVKISCQNKNKQIKINDQYKR